MMLTSDVCLSHDVCRVRLACAAGRPAGMVRIGSSGPARPAWLKAAAARFRCRQGAGGAYCGGLPYSLLNVVCRSDGGITWCNVTITQQYDGMCDY